MESKGKPEIPRSLEDWRPALVAFFRRRVGSFEEAEDLAHDTLLRLVVRDADAECYNDGYVFTVAQNLLHDRNRKAAVRARHSDAPGDREQAFDVDPERTLQGREELARLLTVLDRFPPRTRSMFILYRLENMQQADIGETFGITASAVKQQIAKVMAALAKTMREKQ